MSSTITDTPGDLGWGSVRLHFEEVVAGGPEGGLDDRVILTADPANTPSIRTIQKLGAKFLGEVEVPPDDPAYAGGARHKRRYEWAP